MQGQHTCSICLDELPGASFVWPGGCDHASCKDCVKQLCNLHVAEGGLENLRCPDPKCKEPFDRQVPSSDLISPAILMCRMPRSRPVTWPGSTLLLLHFEQKIVSLKGAGHMPILRSARRAKPRLTTERLISIEGFGHCVILLPSLGMHIHSPGVMPPDADMCAVLGWAAGGGPAAALGGLGAGAVAAEDARLRVLPALL